VAITLNFFLNGAVGFIDWLDDLNAIFCTDNFSRPVKVIRIHVYHKQVWSHSVRSWVRVDFTGSVNAERNILFLDPPQNPLCIWRLKSSKTDEAGLWVELFICCRHHLTRKSSATAGGSELCC